MIVVTKISRSRIIVTNMGNIPQLSNPPIAFATVTATIDQLETAYNLAQTGNRAAIQAVYNHSRELELHMRTYRDYVTVTSDGDGAMILEAGFDLVRLPVPIGELSAPVNGRPMPTEKSSEAVIRWNRVKGASSYVVEYRMENAPRPQTDGTEEPKSDEWHTGALTQTASVTLKGLRSATYYLVRVAANGTTGLSGWSDLIRVLVR